MRYQGTTALITGASSGIGAEFARQFAARGADVVLVARRINRLHDLAAEIKRTSNVAIHVVQMDLTAKHAGRQLADRTAALGLSMDTVVNCAGAGRTVAFTESSEPDIRQQLAINVDAVVSISHAFLPQLLNSQAGTLVNVASLTGYMPTPGMAVYAAAKSFVIRFTEALAYELDGSSLTVLAVSPGPTSTEFFTTARTSTKGVRFETPQQVVATTFAALSRTRPPVSIISGRRNRLGRRILQVLPTRTVLKLASSTSSA